MSKILIITTSHSEMEAEKKATGLWLEELTTPYYVFLDAGLSITVASIKGGVIPVDPMSKKAVGENSPSVERFIKDSQAMEAIENSVSIEEIDFDEYDAIFLPGGHGTMWDLPSSEKLAEIVSQALVNNRIVSAVCHGPAGLVCAKKANGIPAIKGYKISAFTNSEEETVGLSETVPFLLETKLRQLGADFQSTDNFQAFVTVDRNLITGQNPASSHLVAEQVLEKLTVAIKK